MLLFFLHRATWPFFFKWGGFFPGFFFLRVLVFFGVLIFNIILYLVFFGRMFLFFKYYGFPFGHVLPRFFSVRRGTTEDYHLVSQLVNSVATDSPYTRHLESDGAEGDGD